ncbi:MAG TPA: Mpo1-like protein [Hanamia sp.]
MKTVNQWLGEYGQSHQNKTNKLIHWVCVAAIFFSIIGLLYCIKVPLWIDRHHLNVAMFAMLLVILYYLRLSFSIGIGMFLLGFFCLVLCHLIEKYVPVSLWLICVIIFAIAWIGQFYGHNVEGKKPSFLKDIQFLLIGPMWLMSFIYKKMGVKF